jgi:hypothetical protein
MRSNEPIVLQEWVCPIHDQTKWRCIEGDSGAHTHFKRYEGFRPKPEPKLLYGVFYQLDGISMLHYGIREQTPKYILSRIIAKWKIYLK